MKADLGSTGALLVALTGVDWATENFGVPASVILAAVIGATAGLSYARYTTLLGGFASWLVNSVLGVYGSQLLHAFVVEKFLSSPSPGLLVGEAAMMALFGQLTVPLAREWAGRFVRRSHPTPDDKGDR